VPQMHPRGHEGPVAEFQALRGEMDMWVREQQIFFTTQMTFAGVVFAFALADKSRVPLLLIVPAFSYILSARFVANQEEILRIAKYIREDLSKRVPGGLLWEQWIIDNKPRRRAFYWLSPNLFAFAGASIASLAYSATYIFGTGLSDAYGPGLLIAWLIDLAVTTVSAYLIYTSNQVHEKTSRSKLFGFVRRGRMIIASGRQSSKQTDDNNQDL
jgi:hypothetical protein